MTQLKFAQPDNGAGNHWGGNRDIPRDRWGRPLITPPQGGNPVAYTRATTFVDALSDKSNLMAWKSRMAALGLAQRDDLLLRLAGHDPDDKKGIDQIVDAAAEAAGSKRKADIGTALHEATERHDLGEEARPLGKFQPDLDAYIKATSGLEHVAVEQFRVQDDYRIGGTCDRVVRFPGQEQAFIADVKTGGLYDTSKMAMQLSVYAHSTPYDTATSQRTTDPYPVSKNVGLLIHLPAGEATCNLFWLNLQKGWEGVALAAKVREWRSFGTRKATRQEVIVPLGEEETRAAGQAHLQP